MTNNEKKWGLVMLVGVAVVLAITWLSSSHKSGLSNPNLKASEKISPTVLPSDSDKTETAPEDEIIEDEFNPYDDEQLKTQIMQATDQYIAASKYPHYSQPVAHPDQAREYEPFELSEVDTPFPMGDEEPVRLQVAVDKYQYFVGDIIHARVRVVGASSDAFVAAAASIDVPRNNSGTSLQTDMRASGVENEFLASFDSRLLPASLFASEMLLKVIVNIDDRQLFTTASFKFNRASANLIGIPYARPEAEFLEIALQYNVYLPGYYFVSAILADQTTGRPLIKLQTEGHMALGNAILNLKAHVQALKSVASQGPYVLRNIKTYRGAERGEAGDAPSSSSQSSYSINGYHFEQYDDVAHDDDLTNQRIEFLEGIGSVDDDK